MTNPNANGFAGQQGLTDSGSQFNGQSFLIEQMLGRMATIRLVKVTKVAGGGGALGAAGTVNVLPLVNQIDGLGNATKHGTIFKLQYVRAQGGKNAVIMDPEAGDIGLALVLDRDSTAAIKKKGQANPGSRRRFDLSDGVYLGGLVNSTPEQYVRFTSTGVVIADKNGNVWEMKNGAIQVTTTELRVSGNVIAGYGSGDQVSLQNHLHEHAGGVGNSGAPVAGT